MDKQKILVTGANGQLGQELRAAVSISSFEFVFLSREDLPIDRPDAIRGLFETHRPVWLVNCAAYTAVDKAESEKELAFRINGEAVGELAGVCKSFQTRFIHISTDYVFDGESALPLKERDVTGPLNVYGASKLLGEQLALERQPDTVILRTSWVYSAFGNNFVKTMIRLMKERASINVINDQIGSPTYAADLAAVILRIIGTGSASSAIPDAETTSGSRPLFVPGIYNYSNEGQISWYDFALAIREMTGSACRVDPIPTSQYPTAAKRPHYSLLDKALIRATYGIQIPEWRESLAVCLKLLKAND
jgi:dTDP-4-dehydrorhamnose reductase